MHGGCGGLLAVLRVLCCENGAWCSDLSVKTVSWARHGCVRGDFGRKSRNGGQNGHCFGIFAFDVAHADAEIFVRMKMTCINICPEPQGSLLTRGSETAVPAANGTLPRRTGFLRRTAAHFCNMKGRFAPDANVLGWESGLHLGELSRRVLLESVGELPDLR